MIKMILFIGLQKSNRKRKPGYFLNLHNNIKTVNKGKAPKEREIIVLLLKITVST